MNRRAIRLLALVVPALLACAALGVAPTYAGSGRSAARGTVAQDGRLVVRWNAPVTKHPVYAKTMDVPGIGQVDLVCRPDSTMIRIDANDRGAETQMWLAKFETKGGRKTVAVKNVRVYTYDTADDDGRGGTGHRAHEGLNQASPIEDFEDGSAYGLISQRPGRNHDGGGTMTMPATSLRLTWYWERFAYPGYQYCKMRLVTSTHTDQQFGLSWHGDSEAATSSTSTTELPGFGQAQLVCQTGRTGDHTVALRPDPALDPANAYMDYEYVTQEGPVENHVDHFKNLRYDPVTGLLGPVDLPTNGMMRIWWKVGGVKQAWVLSSYLKTNSEAKPWLNLCEVAAAPLP